MSENADIFETISRFKPMNVIYDEKGKIIHAGPTFLKILGDHDPIGQNIEDVLELRDDGRHRDRDASEILPLGSLIFVRLRHGFTAQLKGMSMRLARTNHNLLELSFGISLVDAVNQCRLTAADFAPTDMAIELLYLVEAKSAVLEEIKQLNQRLQGAKLEAEEQAYTDMLTGLNNRRAMDEVLERLIDTKADFAMMHLDLDYFKSVNDTMGHAAGDAVLEKVAIVLKDEIRDGDLVARIGGDEFILIFVKFTGHDKLMQKAYQIIERLEEPVPFGDEMCKISGSIGITTTELYSDLDADEMMRDADMALYYSKDEGRGRPTFFTKGLGEMPKPQQNVANARR